MDRVKFTMLDDKTHVIGPDEQTVCGEVIPHGNGYTTDEPKKLCPKCSTTEEPVVKPTATKEAKSGTKA